MRISDWSSDVCSSDLKGRDRRDRHIGAEGQRQKRRDDGLRDRDEDSDDHAQRDAARDRAAREPPQFGPQDPVRHRPKPAIPRHLLALRPVLPDPARQAHGDLSYPLSPIRRAYIERASCWEQGCTYVEISWVA